MYLPHVVRFIHSADWQLGITRHFLNDEAQARFSGARIDVIRRIGAIAEAEECGFVVVAGDVFESNHVERRVVVRALDAMAASPDVTFYLLPGNHDPLDASSVYRSPTFVDRKPANVAVLEGGEPLAVAPGVELIAAPWLSKRPLNDLVHEACGGLAATESRRIVVGHGALDKLSPDQNDPALVGLAALEEMIDSGSVHYIALGDRHSTTDASRTGRVWYSGAPEPTDYTETDPGNILVVDLGTDNVRVEHRSVGTWRFLRHHWDLTGESDVGALEGWLSGLDDKERTIVKVSLVGQISLALKARLDGLVDHHTDLLAALETWERRSDLVVLPDPADMEDLQLSGFARQALQDLHELAESGEKADVARDALGLLYRLVGDAR